MVMRQRVTDRYLRTEFLQVSGFKSPVGSAEGMYTIYDAHDTTMTMVMTQQRMASIMAMPSVPASVLPSFKVHGDAPGQLEDLGAGETILGHATHRYRTTTHGSVDYVIGEQTCTRRVDAVADMWLAPDIDIRPAMDAVMKHFNRGEASPPVASDVPHSPLADRGTPLRSITQTSYTDPNGQTHVVKTTTEYTELSNAPVEESAFTVPADYHVMDMRKTIAKLAAKGYTMPSTDSTAAVAGRQLAERLCR